MKKVVPVVMVSGWLRRVCVCRALLLLRDSGSPFMCAVQVLIVRFCLCCHPRFSVVLPFAVALVVRIIR